MGYVITISGTISYIMNIKWTTFGIWHSLDIAGNARISIYTART